MAKEKRIVATSHAIVSEGIGYPSRTLAPGEHIVFNEGNDTHKSIEQEIAMGRDTGLKIEEVDVEEGQDDTVPALEGPNVDDVLQAPARALEQEVREAPFEGEKDAKAPKEAKEGAKEVQESVEAEQERQAAEAPGADEETSRGSGRRGSRKGN